MSIVQLSELKLRLGVTTSGNNDLFQSCLDGAESIVSTYIGYPVASGSKTELFDIDDAPENRHIYPSRLPLIGINSVKLDGEVLTTDDYYLYEDHLSLKSPIVGMQIVELNYSHGWGPDSVPTEIKESVISIASRIYQKRKGVFVTNERVGNWSASFSDKDSGFVAEDIRYILDAYKIINV